MKRLPFLLLAAVLALCSCKNPQELINEKAEQYKKEGKIILNKSDDPSGKDHYIVFADTIEQTIGVDTLGEKAQIIKLADVKEHQLGLPDAQGDEAFSIYNTNIEPKATQMHIVDSVTFNEYGMDFAVECYKDKYILMIHRDGDYQKTEVLFFRQPDKIIDMVDNECVKTKDGDLNITIKSLELFGLVAIAQEGVESIYHVTFNSDGLIKKQDDNVNLGGIMIPTGYYGDAESMQPYLNRIENDREANFERDEDSEEEFLDKWLAKHPEYANLDICDQIKICHQETGFDFPINGKACREWAISEGREW